MSLEEDIYIEKYIKGVLSKEELELFNKRMQEDPDLKNRVAFEKKLFENLNTDSWSSIDRNNTQDFKEYASTFASKEIKDLKKNIQTASDTYHKKSKKFKNWYLYASVATIAILLSIYSITYQSSDFDKLYNKYIDFDNLPSFVSRQQEKDSLVIAQQFFEDKDYDSALKIFSKELLAKKNNSSIYIYTGITQTELSKFDEAQKTYDELILSELLDASKGKWYKALLYLKMKKINESKIILNEIIKDSLYNHKKAKELLEKIEN